MVSKEAIEQRLSDAKGKRSRLQSTLDRHKTALEKKETLFTQKYGLSPTDLSEEFLRGQEKMYWDYYAISVKKDEISSVMKKLEDVDKRLSELSLELQRAEATEAFIREEIPQVIKDFFDEWLRNSISFFGNRFEQYQILNKDLMDQERSARITALNTLPEYAKYAGKTQNMSNFDLANVYPRKPMENYLKECNLDRISIESRKTEFAGPVVKEMSKFHDPVQRMEFLNKIMKKEMRERMLDLANRIGKCVGKITDAQHLHIQNGEIAGVIVGKNGRASIQTIGAGGYNIQRYHFRTLVHELERFDSMEESNEESSGDEDDENEMEM